MTNNITLTELNESTNQFIQFLQLYPFLIFVAALVFLGRLLKSSLVPNNFITWILCLVGAIVTPFIADIVPVVKDLNQVMKVCAGFCFGWLSTGIWESVVGLPFIRNSKFFSKLLGFEIETTYQKS